MKERTNNKGSMKHKLLISYIIVFLIPLILSLVVYFISATYISKYSNEMKANEINATNTVVNNLFSTLNGVHYDIQNSNFMNVYSENISARSYDVVKFKNELARACAKNSSFFSDIHIIFNQDNFGVTAFSGDNIENYFESNSELYNESFSNWKTRISKFTDGVFSKYNGGVMYTKTILRDGNNSKATMIIFIPTQTLINLIDNAKIYADTNFTLLDNNNNILFQNNDIELPGKYINENLQDFKINELTSIKYEHKKFTVCHEKYYTFDYITAVGENSVEKSMKYLLFFILLFVAIIIAVGWYVVKQFVDKETKPIKKILEILKVYDDDLLENSDSADEFATIERSIMNRIDKTIKTKPFIADSIVSRIIKGSYNESYMPINFNYPNFQVVLLYFSTLGVFDEKSPPNTGKTNLLLNTAATN
ncbi:MAG: hypothetical protein RSC29_05275, partial [Oscillospiraceae bacterium]